MSELLINLTPLELQKLTFFLCDPTLTFDEALSLAGITKIKEEKEEILVEPINPLAA